MELLEFEYENKSNVIKQYAWLADGHVSVPCLSLAEVHMTCVEFSRYLANV